jgi:hypothetical protein
MNINILKNILAIAAASTLILGLENKRQFLLNFNPELIGTAATCFLWGAIFLGIPAAVDAKLGRDQGTKRFGLLILILQVFVAFSALLSGFGLKFYQVATVELIVALGVIWLLAAYLKLLPGFKWLNLLSPKYYWQVSKGDCDTANEIMVGIVFLAFGYALLRFPGWGDFPLLLGSIVLALSAGREFSNRPAVFPAVLALLNCGFIIYGVIFLTSLWSSRIV